jgi:NADH dehydrogenase
MTKPLIIVLGGTGFVGSYLVPKLCNAGYRVRVLTRRREQGKHLTLLPDVQVHECAIYDAAALQCAIAGSVGVINLIGILHETQAASFAKVHDELPRRLAQFCRTEGVGRLLHMSALQAAHDAPSAYLRSKAAGEAGLLQEAGPELAVTIFRPSVIFGRGDSFLNLFAALVRVMPVLLLGCPQARFQPVYVEDVAHAFVTSIASPATYGQSYNLCGPKVYTLQQLVHYVSHTLGLRRHIVGLNATLSYLQAYALELLPGRLMTRDNYYSMQRDSVCDCPFPAVFGIAPTALEAVAPGYLAGVTPRGAYLRFRQGAGR